MVIEDLATGWRGQVADKLTSPAEAMAIVRPGDTVWMGAAGSVPTTLCDALAGRAEELPGVTVATLLTAYDWDRPELLQHFRIRSGYTGPLERAAVQAGRFEYVPVAAIREGRMPNGFDLAYDVAAIPISPPDAGGYCSFGAYVFFGPTIAATAKQLVGEVHPEFIRTGGQNRIHISKFARLAEAAGPPLPVSSAALAGGRPRRRGDLHAHRR